MHTAVWIGFALATALAFGFFFFTTRRFDLLTIAYIGALFYFSPLFWGSVLQSSADLDSTVPSAVYLIAIGYVIALVLAGVFSDTPDPKPTQRTARLLAGWYLIIAALGLAGALATSKGAIFNADKVEALKQVGYCYVLFEIAASLTCISAVIERRWWVSAAGASFLATDLLVGFRVFTVLTALSVALVMLMRDGRIKLITKAPTYGAAAAVLVVAMLFVHTARFAIYDHIAITENGPRTLDTRKMRSDILQFDKTSTQSNTPDKEPEGAAPLSTIVSNAESAVRRWMQTPFDLLKRSEPSIIQATLAGIVQRNVSCNAWNIFKSLYLLIPPGFTALVPNPFPSTFYDEYKPMLYPNIDYGTGGNIWAEMLCRFGYAGVAIFGVLLVSTLIGLFRLLGTAPRVTAAPLAFGGIVIAFYIGRNDLHFTLVMLRQIAIVFGVAYLLSVIFDRVRGFKPWA